MSLIQLVIILATAATILPLGIRVLVWRHVRDRRLRVPHILVTSVDALPQELGPVFEAGERALLPMGFELLAGRWVESVDRSEGRRPERVYRHAESGAFAFLGPPLPGMGERPYRAGFVSSLRGGGVVATFDGLSHLTPGFPPGWECYDHDVNDLGRQWALHLHSLEPKGGLDATVEMSLEAWTALEAEGLRDTLFDWQTRQLTFRSSQGGGNAGDECWRFRLRPSWALAKRFLQGQRRVLTAEAERAGHRARQQLWRDNLVPVTDALEPDLVQARATSMAWGFEYDLAAKAARSASRSARGQRWAGAAGGAVCMAIFGWWVGWQLAWIVIAVLLIHELGHLAAMEAFGYRDRRILFMPFFGAATLGEKVDATPAQRAMVYLLGPAPGILLGLAALYGFLRAGNPWWLAAATAALLVNYLNLLPISPLDGGRIVETLLLGRFPRAQVIFLGVGALLFAVGAWILRDPILAGISLALTISLRTAWIAAGALVRSRARVDRHASKAMKTRAVFNLLQETPYSNSPAAQRLRLAELVIPRLGQEPATLRTAVAGSMVYLAMLIGVPIAVTGSVYAFAPTVWSSVSKLPAEAPSMVSPAAETPVPKTPDTSPRLSGTGRHQPLATEGARQASKSEIAEASLVGR